MMMQRKNITELLFNSVLSTLKSRNSFFFFLHLSHFMEKFMTRASTAIE